MSAKSESGAPAKSNAFLADLGKSAGFVAFAVVALACLTGLRGFGTLSDPTFGSSFNALVYATMGGGAVAGLRKLGQKVIGR